MKKGMKLLCLVLGLLLAFLLGWRVMPRIWPDIKENMIGRVIPSMRSEPADEVEEESGNQPGEQPGEQPEEHSGEQPGEQPEDQPEEDLYTPESSASFDDEISETDSLVYYFYKDYCPYCKAIDPLMAGLPQQIILPDGTASQVRLICLNKVEDRFLEIITDYYEKYDTPEEKQYVPAVVIGDRYLFTGEEIIDQLMDSLTAGEGLQTPLLNDTERAPALPGSQAQ